MRMLLTFSLNWELRRREGVYGNLRKGYINSVPYKHSSYLVGQHTFAFYTKGVRLRKTAKAVGIHSKAHIKSVIGHPPVTGSLGR